MSGCSIRTLRVHGLAVLIACFAMPAGGVEPNLLRNAEFADGLEHWQVYGVRESFGLATDPETPGKSVVEYTVGAGTHVVHLDQIAVLNPDTLYTASVRVLNLGTKLKPALRIADMDWQTVCYEEGSAAGQWETLRTTFLSADLDQVRVQLFGGGRTNADPARSGRVLFSDAHLSEASAAARRAYFTADITIDPTAVVQTVNPLFFGVNSLFWITNDSARADGRISAALKAMPCRLIRFPGGEVADNYHWRTNRLDDTKAYPFKDGPEMLGFDEFIAWTRDIGAEPICVVNLESGYKSGDVGAGVREAVDWVRYSNVEKHYAVKYWELGNETDLVGTRYPLKAEEYAVAVVQFSTAMKAVDPSICIGALGPVYVHASAMLDTFTPEAAAQARSMQSWEIKKQKKDLARRADPAPEWWDTLVASARDHFDFAIVHRYDNSRTHFSQANTPPLRLAALVSELDRYLAEKLQRNVPIALTEWNTWRSAELGPAEHAITIAEQIGNYLEGGVDMATFWPMRFPRGKDSQYFRALLGFENKAPLPVYYVMQLFSSRMGDVLLRCEVSNRHVYAVSSRHGTDGRLVVFVVNRLALTGGIEATLRVPAMTAAEALSLVSSEADAGVQTVPTDVRRGNDGWVALLPPLSLTVVELAPR